MAQARGQTLLNLLSVAALITVKLRFNCFAGSRFLLPSASIVGAGLAPRWTHVFPFLIALTVLVFPFALLFKTLRVRCGLTFRSWWWRRYRPKWRLLIPGRRGQKLGRRLIVRPPRWQQIVLLRRF